LEQKGIPKGYDGDWGGKEEIEDCESFPEGIRKRREMIGEESGECFLQSSSCFD